MGLIKYPRTFLNIRKQLFPTLNEKGKKHETIGLIEYTSVLDKYFETNTKDLLNTVKEAQKLGWPKIPNKELRTFKNIKPIRINVGTKIYRIIGLDNFKGNYWSYNVPKSELEFRSDFAVRKDWNGNGGYIEIEVITEILAYEGTALAQKITIDKRYVLKGGGNQLWFPADAHFSFDLKTMKQKIKATRW